MPNKIIELNIYLKSYHPYYINRFVLAALEESKTQKIFNINQVFLPKKREHFTVLRSPHVDKKARDQFIRITHSRLLKCQIFYDNAFSYLKIFRFLNILKRLNLGVSLSIKVKIIN